MPGHKVWAWHGIAVRTECRGLGARWCWCLLVLIGMSTAVRLSCLYVLAMALPQGIMRWLHLYADGRGHVTPRSGLRQALGCSQERAAAAPQPTPRRKSYPQQKGGTLALSPAFNSIPVDIGPARMHRFSARKGLTKPTTAGIASVRQPRLHRCGLTARLQLQLHV